MLHCVVSFIHFVSSILITFPFFFLFHPKGLTRDQALKVADKVGLKDQRDTTADMLLKLYDLFLKKDALLVELNPYAENADGRCTVWCFLKIQLKSLLPAISHASYIFSFL